jgi:hypothetical protein
MPALRSLGAAERRAGTYLLQHFFEEGLGARAVRSFELSRSLAGISHMWPSEVAHALVRAVSRLTRLDTLVGYGQSVGTGRRYECRRGTHESVRHIITTECL